MRRQLTVLFVAFLAMVGFSGFGLGVAHASDDSLAVLGLESLDYGDVLGTQVTDALRRRVAETAGIRLVPGKELIELKMIFGCDGEAPACLAQAGRSLGADRLIYGSLKKADGGRSVVVSLKLLDVRDLTVSKQLTETVPRRTLAGNSLAVAAGRWFGQLVIAPVTGAIAVQSQPADAGVLLDDAFVGHTPIKLKDVRPGPHDIIVQLEGHLPARQSVDVHAGAMETVVVRLERLTPVEPAKPPTTGVVEPRPSITSVEEPPKPRHPGRPAKLAAIGLVAGAVVAGAVAIYTWRSYLKLEDSASASLRQIAPMTGTPEQSRFFGAPSCQTPPVADSPAARSYLADCQSGGKYAAATTGLWVSAGLLATAGIVSFIVGDRLDAKAERERRGGSTIQQSLRLLPAISTQGGGLSASFEF